MFQILAAEDDRSTRRLMEAVLKEHGYRPILARDELKTLRLLGIRHVDLVILDVIMPDMDDYELTRQLNATDYTLPILMVTAKQLPEDKRKGFVVRTDDCMTKPVDEEEMILRIRALLRRAQIMNEQRIAISGVCLGYDSLTISRGNESQTLPHKEFYLLYKLLSYPGRIFAHIQLMDEIQSMESQLNDNAINIHINRLRKRFEGYPEFTIKTICGLGYKAMKSL